MVTTVPSRLMKHIWDGEDDENPTSDALLQQGELTLNQLEVNAGRKQEEAGASCNSTNEFGDGDDSVLLSLEDGERKNF